MIYRVLLLEKLPLEIRIHSDCLSKMRLFEINSCFFLFLGHVNDLGQHIETSRQIH